MLSQDIPDLHIWGRGYVGSDAIPQVSALAKHRARKGHLGQMTLFMGLHQSRLDAKGRVSIPASFRAVLRSRSRDGETADLVMRASHNFDCIEGWATRDIIQLSEKLDALAEFSEEANDLNLVLFGEAQPLPLDREGRVVLPEQMLEHACIKDAITIVGTRNTFQLWEPAAYERRRAEARANAPKIKLPVALS